MAHDESWQLWVESMLSVPKWSLPFEFDEQIAMDSHEAMGVQRRVAASSITVRRSRALATVSCPPPSWRWGDEPAWPDWRI